MAIGNVRGLSDYTGGTSERRVMEWSEMQRRECGVCGTM